MSHEKLKYLVGARLGPVEKMVLIASALRGGITHLGEMKDDLGLGMAVVEAAMIRLAHFSVVEYSRKTKQLVIGDEMAPIIGEIGCKDLRPKDEDETANLRPAPAPVEEKPKPKAKKKVRRKRADIF